MSLGVAVAVDGRPRRRVGRTIFVVVVALFAALNVYRSTTLTQSPASSHEFSHRQRLRHSPEPAAGSVTLLPADGRSTPTPEVDRLPLVRSVREDDYPAYNVTVDNKQVRVVPLWQRRLRQRHPNSSANAALEDDIIGPYYFLTELLQVRIYPEDEARWTVKELKQWMHYMLLAGVEHFYVCDHFAADSERLDAALSRYINAGLVTYIPWDQRSAAGTGNPMRAQIRCYQRLVTRYRRRHRWQIAVDVDEYPFSPDDTRENFLARYLDQVPDDVSEISMANYLMLGEGDRTRANTAIGRIIRMTSSPANKLVKPVYRPERLRAVNVHRNPVERGRRVDAAPDQLRMLHYWGARGQQQDPGAARRIMSRTVEMTSMRDAWSQRVENSLIVFGERDAFSNETGP